MTLGGMFALYSANSMTSGRTAVALSQGEREDGEFLKKCFDADGEYPNLLHCLTQRKNGSATLNSFGGLFGLSPAKSMTKLHENSKLSCS